MLRLRHGRAALAPLQPPRSGPCCSRESPRLPPQRGPGQERGGCGTAAPRGNGPGKSSGRQTAAGVQLASPQAVRGPCFPCARCPVEISSRLAGLDGQPEEAAHTEHRGAARKARQNEHHGSPFPPSCVSVPTQPSPWLCRATLAESQCGGLGIRHHPMCWWQSRGHAVQERHGCLAVFPSAWLARLGERPSSPTFGVAPCRCCRSQLPPSAPSPPGLPARLMHSQVRGMKGHSRGTRDCWWQHEGHATSRRCGGSTL